MPSTGTAAVHPLRAIEGGRVDIEGTGFPVGNEFLPEVRVGGQRARVVFASGTRLGVVVPAGLDGGRAAVQVAPFDSAPVGVVEIAAPFATGLHQVDNPVFDRDGNLYVTYSGTRGQQVPVSIFRVRPNGTREPFSSGIVNPTSMAVDAHGRLYVSSRFEGAVYRVMPDGTAEIFAHDLGVTCGLAFSRDGFLFAGDRSGTIFKIGADGLPEVFASLPASVAAFHLAFGGDDVLYVTGPTLSSYDDVYRISPDGTVTTRYARFGRPQGLAVDRDGAVFVVEALAGASGLYRLPPSGDPELVLSGPGLVGVAFDSMGNIVVASNETAYRLSRSG
jgi:sugar lactone lactonase YvrE